MVGETLAEAYRESGYYEDNLYEWVLDNLDLFDLSQFEDAYEMSERYEEDAHRWNED